MTMQLKLLVGQNNIPYAVGPYNSLKYNINLLHIVIEKFLH